MDVTNESELTSPEPQGSVPSNLTFTQLELISEDQLNTIYLYTTSIAIPVCIFGLASNITNIIVFYKMGLSSVSNICFFCLAITDFSCVSYILVVAFTFHPGLQPHAFLPMAMLDVVLIYDSVYYGFCAMGSLITAIINMERSCCVVFPLKVKLIFTRRTIIWLIGGMAVYQIASGLPRAFAIHLTSVISPIHNRTSVIFDFDRFKPRLFNNSIFVSYSVPTFILFIVVLVGTIFLINSFKQSRQLRDSMTGSEKSSLSNKDARLVHMVIFICMIYIVSAAPLVLIFITSFIYPDFTETLYFHNLYYASHIIGDLFQAISGSINIIVYFRMGSKYKDTFKHVFLRHSK